MYSAQDNPNLQVMSHKWCIPSLMHDVAPYAASMPFSWGTSFQEQSPKGMLIHRSETVLVGELHYCDINILDDWGEVGEGGKLADRIFFCTSFA